MHDDRTQAQRAQSLESRERQGLMADQLAEQRTGQEAIAPKGVAGINGHRTSAEPVREKPKAKKRKSSEDEDYAAVVPGSGKKQKKPK